MAFVRQDSLGRKPWDAVGATLSLLCVVHCMAMPLVIAYLPLFGLEWLAREVFHRWVAMAAIVCGAMSFVPSYLRHRRATIPLLGAVGLLVLCWAALAEQDQCCQGECCAAPAPISSGSNGHSIAASMGGSNFGWTPVGGMLVLLAHGLNCHWNHCCRNGRCRSLRQRDAGNNT
jgi:MerC mercury resistance protein